MERLYILCEAFFRLMLIILNYLFDFKHIDKNHNFAHRFLNMNFFNLWVILHLIRSS